MKPFDPSVSLLCKLGSIAVHVDEILSTDGHVYDRITLQQLIADKEIMEWLKAMDKLAMLPKKRK